MSIPTRIFGFLLICTLLYFPVAWGKNETPRESQKILEKSNVGLTPDTNQKFSDLELKIQRVEKELGKIDSKNNEVNQRLLLHDEALLSKDERLWASIANVYVPIFIAFLALGATFYQGYITRRHNKLSVRPDLASNHLLSSVNKRMGLFIQNNGLGPGTIISVAFYFLTDPDKIYTIQELYKALVLEKYNPSLGLIGPGYSVRAGESIELISFDRQSLPAPEVNEISTLFLSIRVKMKYKSFYGEEFSFG